MDFMKDLVGMTRNTYLPEDPVSRAHVVSAAKKRAEETGTVQIIAAQADVGRPTVVLTDDDISVPHEIAQACNAPLDRLTRADEACTPEVLQDAEFADIDVFHPHDASMEEPRVDARKLHQNLGVGRDFSNWIKGRIEFSEFVEGKDFEVFAEIGDNPQGGRPNKEYCLTMDMAKELAMLERNEQGKRIRRYFIACEKRLR